MYLGVKTIQKRPPKGVSGVWLRRTSDPATQQLCFAFWICGKRWAILGTRPETQEHCPQPRGSQRGAQGYKHMADLHSLICSQQIIHHSYDRIFCKGKFYKRTFEGDRPQAGDGGLAEGVCRPRAGVVDRGLGSGGPGPPHEGHRWDLSRFCGPLPEETGPRGDMQHPRLRRPGECAPVPQVPGVGGGGRAKEGGGGTVSLAGGSC